MVELTAPRPDDVICDPACGTAGFLVAAGEYLREHHPKVLTDKKLKEDFHEKMFHGFDFDNTMLRIGSMNMLLHGVENPVITYRDSLAEEHGSEEENTHWYWPILRLPDRWITKAAPRAFKKSSRRRRPSCCSWP